MNKIPTISENQQPANLPRRFAALMYDIFLIIAILFFATIPAISLNDGQSVETSFFYKLYVITIIFLFYAWFWTRGGQTLGMKVWKIKISQFDGSPITWKQAGIRFITSGLGLGHFWILFNANKLGWHEIASNTITTQHKTNQ